MPTHERLVFVDHSGIFCLNGAWFHAGGLFAGHLAVVRPVDPDYALCTLAGQTRHVRLCRRIASALAVPRSNRHAA